MDLDLHGLAGVRVVGGTPADAATVEAELGALRRPLEREPDVVVRFAPGPVGGDLRLIGKDDAGFDDDAFYLLRGRRGARVRVGLAFEAIGSPGCEIVCGTGTPGIPLLREIVNVGALARGALPLHGAAFEHDGTGILATGWSRGGKTEVLLAFMANGGRYVGDEWVYADGAGTALHGTREPVTLWDWNLDDLPEYRERVARRSRMRMRAVRRAIERRPESAPARRATELAERRGSARIDPERLFGPGSCAPRCAFDRILVAESHESDEVTVRETGPGDVARAMAACMVQEHRALLEAYRKSLFAFPSRRNETLDRLEPLFAERLTAAFAGKPAHVVAHPYPARVPSLFEATRPHL